MRLRNYFWPVCRTWNNLNCAAGPLGMHILDCPHRRLHRCSLCLGSHPKLHCPLLGNEPAIRLRNPKPSRIEVQGPPGGDAHWAPPRDLDVDIFTLEVNEALGWGGQPAQQPALPAPAPPVQPIALPAPPPPTVITLPAPPPPAAYDPWVVDLDEEERQVALAMVLSRQTAEDTTDGAGQTGGASSSMSGMD